MNKRVGYSLSACSFLCMIFVIVAISTPVWLKNDSDKTWGLFMQCNKHGCKGIPAREVTIFDKAAQSLFILSIVLLAINMCCCVQAADGEFSPKEVLALFGLAGICMLISMVEFTASNANTDRNFGYSYILGWLSFVFDLLLFALTCVCVFVSPRYALLQ